MKRYLSIFFLILFHNLFGQQPEPEIKQIIDEVRVYTDRKEPFTFYEGQLISFDYYVENTSDMEKQYHRDMLPYVINIREESGKEIKERNPYPHLDLGIKEEDITFQIDPMPARYKIRLSSMVSPWLWGNTSTQILLNIPDSIYRSYRFKPLFFKPGKYEAEIDCRLTPAKERLRLTVKFEILPAVGKVKGEFYEFLNAYSKLIYLDDVIRSEEQRVLLRNFFNIIKENPSQHYASLIFYVLAFESDLFNHLRFQSDDSYIFQMFEIAPKIRPEIPLSTLINFYKLYVHRIDDIRKLGLIKDERQYLDEYLKNIKDLNPTYSETIIKEAKRYLNIEGLNNYAKKEQK